MGRTVPEPVGGSAGSEQPTGRAATETAAPGQPQKWRIAWLLLRNRNFRLYFIGALVSNFGTWLQSTAQVLLAYQLTHSVFVVGLITSAQFAGMVVVSPWAAILADRIGIKVVLVGTQLASAGVAAGMAWRYHAGLLGVHSLFLGSLGLGFAYALGLPLQTALIPDLVASVDATDAVKMNSVSYNAGRALAPALGALTAILVGPGLVFALNSVSFTVFAICLAAIFGRLHSVSRAEHSVDRAGGRPERTARSRRTRMADGLLMALHQPRIFLLLAIVAAVTLADDPVLVLSPVLAHNKLHLPADWVGYFIAALGWGSILASLAPTSSRPETLRGSSRRAAISLIVLAVSVVVFAMGIWTPLSLAAACTAGAAGLFTGAAAQAALLRHHRISFNGVGGVASVAALWAIAWAGTKPFASLLDGWLASHVGIVRATGILVLPAVLIALMEILVPKRARIVIMTVAHRLISARVTNVLLTGRSADLLPDEEPFLCEFCVASTAAADLDGYGRGADPGRGSSADDGV